MPAPHPSSVTHQQALFDNTCYQNYYGGKVRDTGRYPERDSSGGEHRGRKNRETSTIKTVHVEENRMSPRKQVELVVHHDEDNPNDVEVYTRAGSDIVVTVIDEKRQRGNKIKKEQRGDGETERRRNCAGARYISRKESVVEQLSNHPESPLLLSDATSPWPEKDEIVLWDKNEAIRATPPVGQGAGSTHQDNVDDPQDFDSDGGDNGWDTRGGSESGEWNGEEEGNEREPEETREDELDSIPFKEHPCQQSHQPGPSSMEDWEEVGDTNLATTEQMQKAQNPKHEPKRKVCDVQSPDTHQAPNSLALRHRLLEGKIVAITGASRGIGRAIALGFAREGAHIIAHYWETASNPADDDITSLVTEIQGMGQQCVIISGDISDPQTSHNIVQKALEQFGKLDIGVGNAGMCSFRDIWDVTPELMQHHFDVNLNGNMWFIQACARQMKSQHLTGAKAALGKDHWNQEELGADHSLLLILSTTSMTAYPAAAHYAASSTAIIPLVQSMAVELEEYGVRCNALLSGIVMTRMVKNGVVGLERCKVLERRAPLVGNLGRPCDIVGPAVFLAGEQSRFLTGTKLVVDGGASAGGGGGWSQMMVSQS